MSATPNLSQLSNLSWCFSSMGCQELSLDQIARLAAKHGLSQVELRAVSEQINLPAVAREEQWLSRSTKELLGNADVAIAGFNSSAKLAQPFEEAQVEIEAFAPLMAHFGATSLRVFDGAMDLSESWDHIWRWLDRWERLREERDWCFSLAFETHDCLLQGEDIAKLFSQGHQHIGLLWDSHHTWKKAGIDPLKSWREVAPFTTHIHVKDSISKPSARHPFSYVLPGQGEFPLGPLLEQLADDGFGGPVSLEWERLWHPYMPSLDEALFVLREYVAQLRAAA
ncbi:sugar phosphate isomerase/epimerase family protein [Cerasicoccus fimbriatus]|uniref:sugar phosphate isomerase/epimerase family protein n=1 Tax=Cerasicoccus fimbriatus TaxID=3014554 RepID=UPI0022B3AFCB|nr:sugar phosphate isomerase/epimerase [Cerasicoccus sp. TK19100]